MNKTTIVAWTWGLIFTVLLQAVAQEKPLNLFPTESNRNPKRGD
ncbi:hypothetical protein [Runella sp.]|jgi:hypothetical protein|nr:hypothetical protein [Runella sp.]